MIKRLEPTMDWIKYDDNIVLKTPCEKVKFPLTDDDWDAISKMVSYIDTCYEGKSRKYKIKDGIGITANQIGYGKKIIYIHFDDAYNNEHKYLIANPEILEESSSITVLENGEGCLSVKKDHKGYVPRKSRIKIKAIDLFTNNEIIIEDDGLLCICLQHEIDHSNGMLYHDRINKMNPYFKKEEWKKI